MKVIIAATSIIILLLAGFGAFATNPGFRDVSPDSEPLPRLVNADQLPPPSNEVAVSVTDSLYLLGGPGVLSGKFQDAAGLPDRQGWTGIDLHQTDGSHWQVST